MKKTHFIKNGRLKKSKAIRYLVSIVKWKIYGMHFIRQANADDFFDKTYIYVWITNNNGKRKLIVVKVVTCTNA